MLKKILERSSLVAWIPVSVLWIGSLLMSLYGAYLFFHMGYVFVMDELFRSPKLVVAEFLTIIDVFLLAFIQNIFAIGLYELFIGEMKLPEWLVIRTIDQLKAMLASVVVLFLAIYFAQQAVKLQNPLDLMYLGVGIAPVMGVLVLYYKVKSS